MSDATNNGSAAPKRVPRDAKGKLLPGANLNQRGPRKRSTITDLVQSRLNELAADVPFAAQLAEKLGHDPKDSTVAHVIVDALLISAIKGKSEIALAIWNRIEPPTTKIELTGGIDLTAAVARIQTVLGMPQLRVIDAQTQDAAPMLTAGDTDESKGDHAA